ncbi:hypothetical protein A4X13_0g2593 [Tilletia indica]|uniref:BTB domain-containing protein n=1 Tax=Tilletia indica TaxID=43049 RepID=A0A177TXB4_9BASI|nr:hypothetical protein A4X13_0g2593 [Tilletia indica]
MSHTLNEQLHAVGSHVLTTGFSESRWSDTTLLVNSVSGWQAQFNLHGLILSRSSFFARRLPESRHIIIEIFIHDPVVNQEALHICLAHIYGAGSPQQLLSPSTARALLAAASLLELDDLAEWALSQSRTTLSIDSDLISTTRFIASSAAAAAASTSRGSGVEGESSSSSQQQQQQVDGAYMLVHDQWAAMMQQQQQQQQNGNGGVSSSSSSSAPPPPGLPEPQGNNISMLYPSHQPFQDAHRNGHHHNQQQHSGLDSSAFSSAPHMPESDISSASSPNTFDPTTPSIPHQQIHNNSSVGAAPWRTAHSQSTNVASSQHYQLPYPPSYQTRILSLQQALFHYLASALPTELGAFSRQAPTAVGTSSEEGGKSGADRLVDVYVQLDFELFRDVMQSAQLPISSVQERFAFAKRCIALRNKAHTAHLRQQQQQHSNPNPEISNNAAEEQVVLAFGGSLGGSSGRSGSGLSFGGSGSGAGGSGASAAPAGTVQIFRKPVRRRFAKASAALA